MASPATVNKTSSPNRQPGLNYTTLLEPSPQTLNHTISTTKQDIFKHNSVHLKPSPFPFQTQTHNSKPVSTKHNTISNYFNYYNYTNSR